MGTKEYEVTLKIVVETDVEQQYSDIENMLYETMEEVPFSFDVVSIN